MYNINDVFHVLYCGTMLVISFYRLLRKFVIGRLALLNISICYAFINLVQRINALAIQSIFVVVNSLCETVFALTKHFTMLFVKERGSHG